MASVLPVEFHSDGDASTVAKDFGKGPLKLAGREVTIRRARTNVNSMRNHSLRNAWDLIKQHPRLKPSDTVEIKWISQPRSATVNGISMFSQPRDAIGGVFTAPFDDLVLE